MITWADLERLVLENDLSGEGSTVEWLKSQGISDEAFQTLAMELLRTCKHGLLKMINEEEMERNRAVEVAILATAGTAFHLGWEACQQYGKERTVL